MSTIESLSSDTGRGKWAAALSHRRQVLALGAILALALGLRLYGITSPPVDYRGGVQSYWALTARSYYETGTSFWEPINYAHEQPNFKLYEYSVSRLFLLFGEHDYLGRLLSVACSLGTMCLLYGIARRWYGHAAGLWTALFLAVTPASVYFGRTIQPEAMMLLLSAGTMYFFVRWIDEDKFLALVVAGVCWTLAILVKAMPVFSLFPIVYLWFHREGWGLLRSWRFWAFFGICGTAVSLWYGPVADDMVHRANKHLAPGLLTIEHFLQVFLHRMAGILFTPVGYLLALLSLLVKVKHKREYTLHCWILGYILYFFIAHDVCFRVDYYMLPIILPIALLIGRFLALLSEGRIWEEFYGGQAVRRWLAHPLGVFVMLLYFAACGFGNWMERRWVVDRVREMPSLDFMLRVGIVLSGICLLLTLAALPFHRRLYQWCGTLRAPTVSRALILVIALSSLIYLQPLYLLNNDALAAGRWIREHTPASARLIDCSGRNCEVLYTGGRRGWRKHWSVSSPHGIERYRKMGADYYVTTLVDEFNAKQELAGYLRAHYHCVAEFDEFLVFDIRNPVLVQ